MTTPRDGENSWDRAYDDGRVGLRCAVCHLQLAACICPSQNVATATPRQHAARPPQFNAPRFTRHG